MSARLGARVGGIEGIVLSNAFSLTPALSRWERENGIQPHCD